MSLVPSLLQAIVHVEGEALVMHAGDRPYIVAPAGHIELSGSALALEALRGIVAELLPADVQRALDDCGSVQYELPPQPGLLHDHFTVVVARGGDEAWAEIRRHKVNDIDAAHVVEVEEVLVAPEPQAIATQGFTERSDPLIELEEIDKRIQALKEAARQAELTVTQTLAQAATLRDELDEIRAAVREIDEKVAEAQAQPLGQKTEQPLDSLSTFGELLVRTKLDTFAERLRALHGAVADANKRLDALAARDQDVIALTKKVDALGARLDTLLGESDDLTRQ